MHTILQGDVREQLANLPDGSVHCCVTSPPYWALRDYGTPGQLGLEATPELFVSAMVDVFRGVKRVLRDDGTLWLNLGDSYSAGSTGRNDKQNGGGLYAGRQYGWTPEMTRQRPVPPGLKPKDLVGIPWRVAFALQADGWYLRQDIIWHKRSPMPESVRDRCTKSHEYIFLLSKSPRYYFDAEAIKEPATAGHCGSTFTSSKPLAHQNGQVGRGERVDTGFRNMRDVWSLSSSPYKGAHFATFPPTIPERAIKAGTSERGCCPSCGSPWLRVVDRHQVTRYRPNDFVKRDFSEGTGNAINQTVAGVSSHTTGWKQSCKCEAADPVPCTVLEPFCGSGTTLAVAKVLGRDSIGIELNPEYITLANERVESADISMLGGKKKPKKKRPQVAQKTLF